MQQQARRRPGIPPFSGLPLHLQRELALVAWTALAAIDHPEGRPAALSDLAAAARAVAALVPEAKAVADDALVALADADATPVAGLQRRCVPMVETFDALLACVRWATIMSTLSAVVHK